MNTRDPLTPTPDPRGFRYALAPYVQQQQWALTALMSRQARAEQAARDARSALSRSEHELAVHTQQLQQASRQRPDPAAHQQAMTYLTALQQRLQQQRHQLEQAQAHLEQARGACLQQQRKVEGLEQHRNSARAEFLREQERQGARAADHDWLARRQPGAKA